MKSTSYFMLVSGFQLHCNSLTIKFYKPIIHIWWEKPIMGCLSGKLIWISLCRGPFIPATFFVYSCNIIWGLLRDKINGGGSCLLRTDISPTTGHNTEINHGKLNITLLHFKQTLNEAIWWGLLLLHLELMLMLASSLLQCYDTDITDYDIYRLACLYSL